MSKKILSAIVALVVVFAMFIPTASAAITNPVADEADFNKVIDGWYISADGGFKMNVGEWIYYGQYGITLAASTAIPTDCCTVAIYPNTSSSYDAPEVFENKTKEAFETVLSETVDVFEKKTIGNAGYTMYYAKTATYENYVFQTENAKYFINFICAGDKAALAGFAAAAIESIVLAGDEAVVPPPPTGDNTALIAVGTVAIVAFVALVATKKRARAK